MIVKGAGIVVVSPMARSGLEGEGMGIFGGEGVAVCGVGKRKLGGGGVD